MQSYKNHLLAFVSCSVVMSFSANAFGQASSQDFDVNKIQQPVNMKLLGSYSTKFHASNVPRSHNIKVATEKINNTLLAPGEVFRYNTVVGKRTRANGFKTAMVIMNKKRVPGIGGGICQASTTLYNAALLANMPIIERHPHSLPVDYVPRGKDATVSYGSSDFVFKNPLKTTVLIKGLYEKGKVTFQIWKKDGSDRDLRVTRSAIKLSSPTLQTNVNFRKS